MLTEICQEIKNWFADDNDKHVGDFEISNGKITPLYDLQEGQYYRIVGSVFNDGVHRSDDILTDEKFHGGVWLMKIPKVVLDLDKDISDWIGANKDVLASPYQSESFGGYSYTKASGNANGSSLNWQYHFASELNKWRKIR